MTRYSAEFKEAGGAQDDVAESAERRQRHSTDPAGYPWTVLHALQGFYR